MRWIATIAAAFSCLLAACASAPDPPGDPDDLDGPTAPEPPMKGSPWVSWQSNGDKPGALWAFWRTEHGYAGKVFLMPADSKGVSGPAFAAIPLEDVQGNEHALVCEAQVPTAHLRSKLNFVFTPGLVGPSTTATVSDNEGHTDTHPWTFKVGSLPKVHIPSDSLRVKGSGERHWLATPDESTGLLQEYGGRIIDHGGRSVEGVLYHYDDDHPKDEKFAQIAKMTNIAGEFESFKFDVQFSKDVTMHGEFTLANIEGNDITAYISFAGNPEILAKVKLTRE